MIEVPQEVQEILKSDSTHKEFVVHFPNGECPDITNENIVSESVKFEESICSQQQFKYGLAEASALEFEFVDEKVNDIPKWGNIKGMEIEAGMKYDFDPAIVKIEQVPPITDIFNDEAKPNYWVKEMPTDCTSAKMTFYNTEYRGLCVYGIKSDGTFSGRITFSTSSMSYTFNGYDYWVDRWSDSNVTRIFYGFLVGDPQSLPQYLKLEEITTSLGTTVVCDRIVTTYNDFTIPYGIFKVESCPRNHGDMAHRKVTAYGQSISTNDDLPGFERLKLSSGWYTSQLTYNVDDLIRAWCRNLNGLNSVDACEGTPTPDSPHVVGPVLPLELKLGTYSDGGQTYDYLVSPIDQGFGHMRDLGEIKYSYGYKRIKTYTVEEMSDIIYEMMSNCGETITPVSDIEQKIKTFTDIINSIYYSEAHMNSTSSYDCRTYRGSSREEYLLLPDELMNENRLYAIDFMRYVGFRENVEDRWTIIQPAYDIYIYDYNPVTLPIKFDSTLDAGSSARTRYYYYNSYSYKAVFDGILELMAEYVRPSRYGGLEAIEMNDSNPYSIVPSDYSECWWEEYEVEPIGAVRYKYTLNNEDQEVIYSFGEGTSVYDMGANAFFDKLPSKTEAIINGLLDTYFIPKLQYIRFVPADITMRALPFLEAGDCIEVVAEDGEIIKTYIMHQTIDGIQSLEADISSVDGSIIETDTNSEVEDET